MAQKAFERWLQHVLNKMTKFCHWGSGKARCLDWAMEPGLAGARRTPAKSAHDPAPWQLSSLCCSRNVLQVLRSFLARHSLRAWTHLCAQVYDCNCLSPINIIKGHNPTKGLLRTIIFKVSLIRRRLQFPESVFLFYFREKVSNVWYHCANIFNSM